MPVVTGQECQHYNHLILVLFTKIKKASPALILLQNYKNTDHYKTKYQNMSYIKNLLPLLILKRQNCVYNIVELYHWEN